MRLFGTWGARAPVRRGSAARSRPATRLLGARRVAIGGLTAVALMSAWVGVAGAATSPRVPAVAPGKAKSTVLVTTATVASLGSVVVSAQHFTLYVFGADKPGAIACVSACASEWPPLLVPHGQKTVHGAKGLKGFGTEKRPDGKLQVTFHGMPLYRFSGDTHPGDANGEGVAGLWYALHPDGSSTKASGDTAAPATTAPPTTAAPSGSPAGSSNQSSSGATPPQPAGGTSNPPASPPPPPPPSPPPSPPPTGYGY